MCLSPSLLRRERVGESRRSMDGRDFRESRENERGLDESGCGNALRLSSASSHACGLWKLGWSQRQNGEGVVKRVCLGGCWLLDPQLHQAAPSSSSSRLDLDPPPRAHASHRKAQALTALFAQIFDSDSELVRAFAFLESKASEAQQAQPQRH